MKTSKQNFKAASFIAALCLLSTLFFAPLSFAKEGAAEATGPKVSVSTVIEKAKAMVDKPGIDTSSESFRKDFKKVIFSVFDFKEMARRSLGKNWKTATDAEKTEFVQLFSQLLSKTYLNRVINGFPNSKIDYGEETVKGKKASLKTKVTSDTENVSVNYRLRNKKGEWKIYDIVIENISLVSNYRSEFSGIVRKEKMIGLINKLKGKIAKNEAKG